MTPPRQTSRLWQMHAVRRADGALSYPGHERFAAAYAMPGDTVVQVEVAETEAGPYYGWIATDHDAPTMVFDNPGLFNMCFPYGWKAEVDHGNGEMVRLSVVEVPR